MAGQVTINEYIHALENGRATLYCNVTVRSRYDPSADMNVKWFEILPNGYRKPVWSNGAVSPNYNSRGDITATSHLWTSSQQYTSYSLTFQHVRTEDRGDYYCVTPQGYSSKRIHLLVAGNGDQRIHIDINKSSRDGGF